MAKCVNCQTEMFIEWLENPETGELPKGFVPNGSQTKPGQVYSYMGRKETNITGLCEHCFDSLMHEDNFE